MSELESIRLEPKVMELLAILAEASPRLVTREELMASLWPDTVVGDDALARCVLKLRRALGDEARDARFVETLPKRGYRLLQPPRPVARAGKRPVPVKALAVIAGLAVLALGLRWSWVDLGLDLDGGGSDTAALLERAHDHYYQFTRQGNEAAAALYQRLLEREPRLAAARAGMANVLAQRLIRWPEDQPEPAPDQQSVAAALDSRRLDTPWARSAIARAVDHAREAVATAPDDPQAHKSLGLALSLAGDLDGARAEYREALELDPQMWEAWINLGELDAIDDDPDAAIANFVRAYQAMSGRYAEDARRIGRWQAELGTMIGDTFRASGRIELAAQWYQRVLDHTPLHVGATLGLAEVRERMGDLEGARSLCADLVLRLGPMKACGPFLPGQQAPGERESR